MKIVHKTGYVYNDLKLENIMLMGDLTELSRADIHLIDFGLTQKFYSTYKSSDGYNHVHIEQSLKD